MEECNCQGSLILRPTCSTWQMEFYSLTNFLMVLYNLLVTVTPMLFTRSDKGVEERSYERYMLFYGWRQRSRLRRCRLFSECDPGGRNACSSSSLTAVDYVYYSQQFRARIAGLPCWDLPILSLAAPVSLSQSFQRRWYDIRYAYQRVYAEYNGTHLPSSLRPLVWGRLSIPPLHGRRWLCGWWCDYVLYPAASG